MKIIIQGLPGVGKTTLVKKIATKLKENNVELSGFITEEIRSNNRRIGFDIVSLKNNEQGILARKSQPQERSMPQVGTYSVYIDDFEKIALPVFVNSPNILIIDEIGKMELISKRFEYSVKNILNCGNITIIATVPLKGGGNLIRQIKENKDSKLVTVTEANRNQLVDEIIKLIEQIK